MRFTYTLAYHAVLLNQFALSLPFFVVEFILGPHNVFLKFN